MEFLLSGLFSDSTAASDGIQRCPFLRNINEPTSFSFGSALPLSSHHRVGGAKGPIFEDGPNFDVAFRLFHGRDGVVPLSGGAAAPAEEDHREADRVFNPLAAKAATISLSGFGGAFGFDFFAKKWDRMNKKQSKQGKNGGNSSHEASSNEWLETGQCPIAKSYRAVSHVLPLVAKALQPPPGIKFKCPPAIVAARAALARTTLVKNLRPQPLPSKMLAIALLGMAVNVPLGIWREHTVKFSPQWIMAVHAAVPFIAMLRKSVLMPKSAMAFTIAASILGQTIGSRAERIRLKSIAANSASSVSVKAVIPIENGGHCGDGEARAWNPLAVEAGGVGHCGDGEARAWNPLAVEAGGIGSAAASPKASVCY